MEDKLSILVRLVEAVEAASAEGDYRTAVDTQLRVNLEAARLLEVAFKSQDPADWAVEREAQKLAVRGRGAWERVYVLTYGEGE